MIRAYARWVFSPEGGMIMLIMVGAAQLVFTAGLLAGWWR